MTDSPFNSVHLHALPRRQDYRRARDLLLRSRGERTLAVERGVTHKGQPTTPTQIEKSVGVPRYALRSGDTIYPLKVGLNTIGRFAENDVVVPEGYMSRRHCILLSMPAAAANCTTSPRRMARFSTAND